MMKNVKTINVCLENGKVAVRFVNDPKLADLIVREDGSFIPVFQKENPIEKVSVFKGEFDNSSFDLKENEVTNENMSTELKEKEIVSDDIEIQVTNFLKEFGVPAHIKGYNFSRTAIIMCINNPQIINAITKELYPGIAEKFNSSPSKVERAIRNAIKVAWNRGNKDFLKKHFKFSSKSKSGRPSNSEFIAIVTDYFILKNME